MDAADTGARLVVGLADDRSSVAPLTTPAGRAAALVDVLLLADAVPRRREPERHPTFPRLDSTAHQGGDCHPPPSTPPG